MYFSRCADDTSVITQEFSSGETDTSADEKCYPSDHSMLLVRPSLGSLCSLLGSSVKTGFGL